MDHTFGVVSEKAYHIQGHLGFLPCYLLAVLHVTFRSVIHFELIFVKSIRPVSRFIFRSQLVMVYNSFYMFLDLIC